MRFSTSDTIDARLAALRERVGDLTAVEGEPVPGWQARTLTLSPTVDSTEKIYVIETSAGIDLNFGHGLSIEFATAKEQLEESLEQIEALLQTLVFEGFCERLWIKDGEVVQSEAVITYAGSARAFRTRGLARLTGCSVESVIHSPWT